MNQNLQILSKLQESEIKQMKTEVVIHLKGPKTAEALATFGLLYLLKQVLRGKYRVESAYTFANSIEIYLEERKQSNVDWS